jgi:hypothetical protein
MKHKLTVKEFEEEMASHVHKFRDLVKRINDKHEKLYESAKNDPVAIGKILSLPPARYATKALLDDLYGS